jgi:uncharacterized protein (DUF488 family)
VEVYTIGFTKKSAEEFFGCLQRAGIKRLLDVRLRNSSQLAGFTKRDDLAYFLDTMCGAEYLHEPLLAPSVELFEFRRKQNGSWPDYERRYRALLADRRVEDRLDPGLFAVATVLLCTETTADECHRRLALEYLQDRWGSIEIIHL